MAGETLLPTPEARPGHRMEVLLIDGNEEHQTLSAIALGRQGFLVTAATSGREGLRLALSKPFDAIVLDHKVRDRIAFEVLQTLAARLPRVPKIFVVAPGSEDLAVRALSEGAAGYLVKTAGFNEVLPSQVEEQIRKSLIQVRLEEQQRALVDGVSERMKVEEALRGTEERLHLLLEQAPFILWTTDPEMRVTSSVGSGLASLNLAPQRVLGKTLLEVFGLTDPDLPLFDAHRRALTGETVRLTTRWMRRFYDLHVGPLRSNGSPVIGAFGLALDVTDRVRRERIESALFRISEATHAAGNLDMLFRLIHDIVGELMPVKNFYIALQDPATGMIRFPYFVDEEEEPPAPQAPGRGLTDYVLRTGKALLASPDVFDGLVASGEVVLVGPPSIDWLGVPLTTKDRTLGVLVVQSYTEGVRYDAEDRDVLKFVSAQIAMAIERKEAEAASQEKERFVSTLMSNLPGIAYRCRNDPEWTDEFLSEGVHGMLGYTPEDIQGGVSWGTLIHPDDRETVWDEVQAAVTARVPYRLTYRIRTRGGQFKWVWEQGRGVYGPDGELIALEGFITDVSPSNALMAAGPIPSKR